MNRALARLAGLSALLYAVELLERVAYRAGVYDGAATVATVVRDVAEDLADDLTAADVSDVVAAHADCCPVPV